MSTATALVVAPAYFLHMTTFDRNQLRQSIRQQRRALSTHQQDLHAQSLAQQVCRHKLFLNAKRIACYLAEDGEIDPSEIINKAWQYKKDVYLPILPPTGKSLFFAPYTADTPLKPNCFGILEPDIHPTKWLRARQLNLILLPLVAFDEQGQSPGHGRRILRSQSGLHRAPQAMAQPPFNGTGS